jgi:hypothetical protein
MSIELRKRITVHNRKGECTYDGGDQPSNSFVKGFLQHLQMIGGNLTTPRPTMKTVTGASFEQTVDTIWASTDYPMSVDNDTDDENWGIVIGSDDTTPEANDNYRLDAVIEAGAAAGQVNYGVTSWDASVTVDGGEVSWSFSRPMTNNSGASITVKEIGVIVRTSGATPNYYVLIIRDILSPAITIPDGETMTVQYTIKTDVTV